MSFRRLILGFTFLAIFAFAVRVTVDTDTWWHLRAGAWMIEHRQILRADPFSLTRFGQPWIYPGWLAQILLYQVFATLGYAGLNLLTALIVVLTFAFLWQLLEAPSLFRAAVLLLAATTSSVYWSARPQILSFALAGIFLWVLSRARNGVHKGLWILPILMALWSNLHGGFALGFILIMAYLLGDVIDVLGQRIRRVAPLTVLWRRNRSRMVILIAVGLTCALAVGLNPHGLQMLLYPFKTISVGVLQDYIQEWQSPNFHMKEAQPFLWMLILTMVSLAFSRRKVQAVEIVLVVGIGYMSFMAARNIAIFALVSAPTIARHGYSAIEPHIRGLSTGPQVPKRLARWLNVVLLCLLLVATGVKISIPLDEEVNLETIAEQAPIKAIGWIRGQQPDGPLFNSYNWGGYVLWSLYPEYQSFVDGRTDLFDDEILNEYILVWRADSGWEDVIDKWGIRLVLIEPGSPLKKVLMYEGWQELFVDEQAVILQHPNGS